MGLKTANREIITTSINNEYESDPSEMTVKTSPEGGFMFSIYLFGVDLSSTTNRMFDVAVNWQLYVPLMSMVNQTTLTMVPCTR